jgi:hypothetical protein
MGHFSRIDPEVFADTTSSVFLDFRMARHGNYGAFFVLPNRMFAAFPNEGTAVIV